MTYDNGSSELECQERLDMKLGKGLWGSPYMDLGVHSVGLLRDLT